jgi:lipopolysaccharide transport system permease protein
LAALCFSKFIVPNCNHRQYNQMSSLAALSWKQTKTFTVASIRSRYRNTFAGFIWVICGPLVMYAVQGYVFSTILKVDYQNYLLFLLSGLLPWIFFQQSISMSTTQIFNQARLLKSFPIHPLTSLVALILDNLINFMVAFIFIFIGLYFFLPTLPTENMIYLLPALLSLLIGTLAVGWFLSVLQIFFYDTKFVVDYGMVLLFYLTPIFYPAHFVPEKYQWMVTWNPLGRLLAPFQALSQADTAPLYPILIAKSFLVSGSLFLTALLFWKWKKNALYFKL